MIPDFRWESEMKTLPWVFKLPPLNTGRFLANIRTPAYYNSSRWINIHAGALEKKYLGGREVLSVVGIIGLTCEEGR
jgi:hypothetical protein